MIICIVTFLYLKMRSSLFDCCSDMSVCCLTMFCCQIQNAINFAHSREEECTLFHFICPSSPLYTRTNIRKKRGYEPDLLSDGLTYILCMPCAICQDARELTIMSVDDDTMNINEPLNDLRPQ